MFQFSEALSDSFKGVWTSDDGEIYLSFMVGSGDKAHLENHPITSRAAEGWMRRFLRHKHNRAATSNEVENLRSELISKAFEEGYRTEAFLRIGSLNEVIYVDLGTSDWSCVEITAQGWQIIPQAPLAFRRNAHMHPLPMPERGGSFEMLQEIVNTTDHVDFLLLVSFIINACHPTGPYFHLLLIGEKGSGKSGVAVIVQSLVHPSSNAAKGHPKNEDNLVIEAFHNRFVMIDNENDLEKWLVNALCRLATGAGMSSRTLYTNRDQMAFKVSRPAIITAHKVPAEQDDFIERSIIVNLNRLPKFGTTEKIGKKLEKNGGKILGAIFDAISYALAQREVIPEESLDLHRMADASYFIACAAEKIGWQSPQDFLQAISAVQEKVTIEKNPNKDPLLEVLTEAMRGRNVWEDTPQTILSELRRTTPNPHLLPEAPNAFSRRLNKVRDYLFPYGLVVETGLKAKGGADRLIRITKNVDVLKQTDESTGEQKEVEGHDDKTV